MNFLPPPDFKPRYAECKCGCNQSFWLDAANHKQEYFSDRCRKQAEHLRRVARAKARKAAK